MWKWLFKREGFLVIKNIGIKLSLCEKFLIIWRLDFLKIIKDNKEVFLLILKLEVYIYNIIICIVEMLIDI